MKSVHIVVQARIQANLQIGLNPNLYYDIYRQHYIEDGDLSAWLRGRIDTKEDKSLLC